MKKESLKTREIAESVYLRLMQLDKDIQEQTNQLLNLKIERQKLLDKVYG